MEDVNKNIDLELIDRSFRTPLTLKEEKRLNEWLKSSPAHREYYRKRQKRENSIEEDDQDAFILAKKRVELIDRLRTSSRRSRRRIQLRRIFPYAALFTLFMGVGVLYFLRSDESVALVLAESNDILPGNGKVLLETADGVIHFIDSLEQTGMLSSFLTVHMDNKELVYRETSMDSIVYNKIIVPRGGEYQLKLSDGTHIWLNSGSELRYPITFGQEERKVFLTGEAYFEVAPRTQQPFIVAVGDLHVSVYGTKFNINTHIKDRIETVLEEGSIGLSILGKSEECLLKPNELGVFDTKSRKLDISCVDPYGYIAWKEGEFVFNDEPIEQIMERLARWYDVDVFFANDRVRNLHYTGVIARFTAIQDLLGLIEATLTIKFTIQDRVIIVN